MLKCQTWAKTFISTNTNCPAAASGEMPEHESLSFSTGFVVLIFRNEPVQ